jgi:hypothetical protein
MSSNRQNLPENAISLFHSTGNRAGVDAGDNGASSDFQAGAMVAAKARWICRLPPPLSESAFRRFQE